MTLKTRSANRRQQILEKGQELFTRQGYHGTGLKEILEACNVPKGSFYNFFTNKELFALEVLDHYLAVEYKLWRKQLAPHRGNHLTRIKMALRSKISEYESTPDKMGGLLANLSGEVGQATPLFQSAIYRATEKVINSLEEEMLLCQKEGSVRDDMLPRHQAEIIWDSWQGAQLRMKVSNSVTPLKHHVEHTLRLLI